MKTLVTVWFSPDGAIICEDCRLDYVPRRLRPSHVPAGLVECAHCHGIIGGALTAYIGDTADPWCNRCQAHHLAPCTATPERSEAQG